METIRRFASETRLRAETAISSVFTLLPSGFFTGRVLPFLAALLFGTFAIEHAAAESLPLSAEGGAVLPIFALAFMAGIWTAGLGSAYLPAAVSASLGGALGCMITGRYIGALSIALLLLVQLILRPKRDMGKLYCYAAFLALMLAMLPVGVLLGAYQAPRPRTVTEHIIRSSVALLLSMIEAKALSTAVSLRMNRAVTDETFAALSVLGGLIAASFGAAHPLGIGLGAAFAAAFVMTAAQAKGIAAVASAAIVAALRVLLTGGDLLFIAVLCSCTLTACLCRSFGKPGVLAGFCLPAIAFFAAVHGTGALKIGDLLLASAVFVLIPKRFTDKLGIDSVSDRTEGLEQRLIYQNYKLTVLSDVLLRLASLFESGAQPADGFINRQLTGVADSLGRISSANLSKRARYTLEFGCACRAKNGSPEAGDSMIVRDFDGVYIAALSDGMGSGSLAKRESSQAVALLADLVTCGFRLEEAAECVNRLLLLREGGEMYATLDAILLDPIEGRISLAKHGAPPSYILRGGKLSTLYAEALPVGIVEEASPAVCSLRMRSGDILIMLSDGAADAFGAELENMLSQNAGRGSCELSAEMLCALAFDAGGGRDDVSVLIARIE